MRVLLPVFITASRPAYCICFGCGRWWGGWGGTEAREKHSAVENRHKAVMKSSRRLWDFKQFQVSGLQSSQDSFVMRNLGIAIYFFFFLNILNLPSASSLHKMEFLLECLVLNQIPAQARWIYTVTSCAFVYQVLHVHFGALLFTAATRWRQRQHFE